MWFFALFDSEGCEIVPRIVTLVEPIPMPIRDDPIPFKSIVLSSILDYCELLFPCEVITDVVVVNNTAFLGVRILDEHSYDNCSA